MRVFPALRFRLSVFLFVAFVIPGSGAAVQNPAGQARRIPVIVELFTSEGCSSCPPADALLQRLQKQQPVAGAEIIPLEEHVDYWNHDGWFDPYSSGEWTERQQEYVALERNDAYTPEMVVDGQRQFVGNNARQAEREIEKALSGVKTEVLVGEDRSTANGNPHFKVSVGRIQGNANDPAEIWLAVTEDGLHSSVQRGENAGRVLQHIATLRLLRKIGTASGGGMSFTGEPEIKFESGWKTENLHVTAFVQRKRGREILGAASVAVKD